MKNIIRLILASVGLAMLLASCASPRPVREYEENTKTTVSEKPVVGR